MEGSCGVERTLKILEEPSSRTSKKSVNVPPTSIPILKFIGNYLILDFGIWIGD
jgi:hypothetical protein